MFEPDDNTRCVGVNLAPQAFQFGDLSPMEVSDRGSEMWWVRSQAIIYNHIRAATGDVIVRERQADEYAVLLPDSGTAVIRANDTERIAVAPAVVFVPAGQSEICPRSDMTIIRLFVSATAGDLATSCVNHAVYATPDPNVAPFEAWPDPPTGPEIHVYPIDDIEPSSERFGRILRSSNFMINWFYPEPGPRDATRLSPHHHDDFEQLSLQLAGDYVHHIRTPWTADSRRWREDAHLKCSSPAVVVIPPPAIHTSQAVGDAMHQVIDIFCPPRTDFSERRGWVVNEHDYPARASDQPPLAATI